MSSQENEAQDRGVKVKSKKLRPLRVIIIEPGDIYYKSVCYGIAVGISQVMLGATLMTVLIYSIMKNDPHVALTAIAYHFFSGEAILSLNYANGWSTSMRLKHRLFAHVCLQTCGIICGIIGAVLIIVEKGLSVTAHGLAGFITTILMCVTFFMGPCSLFGKNNMKILHTTFGIPAFILSSVCFGFGIFTSAFQDWTHPSVVYVMASFIIFYTVCILIMCIIKYSMRVK